MIRPPVLDADPSGFHLLPFAKKRLAHLEERRQLSGCAFLRARVFSDGAATVDVEAGAITHRIRIRAGTARFFFRYLFSDVVPPAVNIYDSVVAYDEAGQKQWQVDFPVHDMNVTPLSRRVLGCSSDGRVVFISESDQVSYLRVRRIVGGAVDDGVVFDLAAAGYRFSSPVKVMVSPDGTRAYFDGGNIPGAYTGVSFYYGQDLSPQLQAFEAPFPFGLLEHANSIGGSYDLSTVYAFARSYWNIPGEADPRIPYLKIQYTMDPTPSLVATEESLSVPVVSTQDIFVSPPAFAPDGTFAVPYGALVPGVADGATLNSLHYRVILSTGQAYDFGGDTNFVYTNPYDLLVDTPRLIHLVDDARGFPYVQGPGNETRGVFFDGVDTVYPAAEIPWAISRANDFVVVVANPGETRTFVRSAAADRNLPGATGAAGSYFVDDDGASVWENVLAWDSRYLGAMKHWAATVVDGEITGYGDPRTLGGSIPTTYARAVDETTTLTLTRQEGSSVYPMTADV